MIPYENLDRLSPAEKAEVLHYLLEDLHRRGLISEQSLTAIGGEIALRDYCDDEDMTDFSCLDHEMHEG